MLKIRQSKQLQSAKAALHNIKAVSFGQSEPSRIKSKSQLQSANV